MRTYIKRLIFVVPILLVALVLTIHHSGANPTPAFTYYDIPTPGSTPYSVAQGADGAMWFTESAGNKIGHINGDGSISEYSLPHANSDPKQITAGPDGNMWFTEDMGNRIGRIAMDGTITEYTIPGDLALPTSITAGPDGNMWFTEPRLYKIGKITMSGDISSYPGVGSPYWITAGADGALWATASTSDQVARYGTDGQYTNYYYTTHYSVPAGITSGPDGALWFAEAFSSGDPLAGNKVGRLTTDGQLAEYPFPESGAPSSISAGPNDSLWATWNGPQSGNRIYAVSTVGDFTDYTSAQAFGYLNGLTHDNAGHLWFTDRDHNQIVMMDPAGSTPPPPVAVPTAVTLTPTAGVGTVDGQASFAATVTDQDNQPMPDATVRFTVSGSDDLEGLCVTDTSGKCAYGYTGPAMPGADSVAVYVDSNDNGQVDTGEPVASATQAWTLPQVTAGQTAGGGQLAGIDGVHDIAFGFNAKSDDSGLKGNCQLIDQVNNLTLHCQEISSLTITGNTASIFGTATINKDSTPVNFRLDATDNGEAGTADTFKLSTDVGYDVQGTLTGGNIQIKQ
jgi:virginiamycin B lyase